MWGIRWRGVGLRGIRVTWGRRIGLLRIRLLRRKWLRRIVGLRREWLGRVSLAVSLLGLSAEIQGGDCDVKLSFSRMLVDQSEPHIGLDSADKIANRKLANSHGNVAFEHFPVQNVEENHIGRRICDFQLEGFVPFFG